MNEKTFKDLEFYKFLELVKLHAKTTLAKHKFDLLKYGPYQGGRVVMARLLRGAPVAQALTLSLKCRISSSAWET